MSTASELAPRFHPDRSLLREIEVAESDPAAYVASFAKRLDDRGIDSPTRDLPWIALVDGLLARKVAVEIDHREDSASLCSALRKILPAKARRALPSPRELDELSPAGNQELLPVIGDRLHDVGIALVQIDLKNDAFSVVPLPIPVATALVARSRRLVILAGADLPKLRKAHDQETRTQARRAARASRLQLAGGPAWATFIKEHDTFASALFALGLGDPDIERRFLAAAKEAPAPHREKAQAIAAVLTNPESAARRLPPLAMLEFLAKYQRQTVRTIGSRVRALSIVGKRLRLEADPKATTAFLAACRVHTPLRQAARQAALPTDLVRWKAIAESRFFSRAEPNAGVALFWLGDQDTLERLLANHTPPKRGEITTLNQDLVIFLRTTLRSKRRA